MNKNSKYIFQTIFFTIIYIWLIYLFVHFTKSTLLLDKLSFAYEDNLFAISLCFIFLFIVFIAIFLLQDELKINHSNREEWLETDENDLNIARLIVANIVFILFLLFGMALLSKWLSPLTFKENKEYLLQQCWFNQSQIDKIVSNQKKDLNKTIWIYKGCLKKLDDKRSLVNPNLKWEYIKMFQDAEINSYSDWSVRVDKPFFTNHFANIKEIDKNFSCVSCNENDDI